MSTKIHTVRNGTAAGPRFYIKTTIRGRETVVRPFGKCLYSPFHHLDAEGRPIPGKRAGRTAQGAPMGGYVPSVKPTTVIPLDRRAAPEAKK